MAKKILLIVEGQTDEPAFFKCLFNTCYRHGLYEVFSYNTNVHVLAQYLHEEYPDFDTTEIEIKSVLAVKEKDLQRKKILLDTYTDVYLIFDFDPQHNATHFDLVKRMLKYFNDPTDHGKLYINYPMMQSYKHFPKLPDPSFAERRFCFEDANGSSYKQLVGKESGYTDLRKYNYKIFYSLAVHHLKKLNYILKQRFTTPSGNEYENLDFVDVYAYEEELFTKSRVVAVLNTCIFVLCDFAPQKFFRFIESRAMELYI